MASGERDPRKRASFRSGVNTLRHSANIVKSAFSPPVPDEIFYSELNYDNPTFVNRRDALEHAKNGLGNSMFSLSTDMLEFLQGMVNGAMDKLIGRRKLFVGMLAFTLLGAAMDIALVLDRELFQDAALRIKLDSVWDQVTLLENPPTHNELLENVYNKFKPIQITGQELESAVIVTDEDSEGVPNGVRKNSLGPDQPNSWPILAAQKLNTGLKLLKRKSVVQAYNFSQPGASSKGLIGYENPEGNVQLGASSSQDMSMDHAGESTPTDVMINHEGFLFAAMGLHGDDMRDTADCLLSYIDPDSDNYSHTFANFIQHPTREKLNNSEVSDVLLIVLTTYKEDQKRIKTNFKKALDDYAAINNVRKRLGKGRMVLAVSQPPALDEYATIPYVPLNSSRGTTGMLQVNQYGPAGHLAAFWTMAPFYLLEKDLLKNFENETGIQVTSIPLLGLQIPKQDLAPDSHLNMFGQNTRANAFVNLVNVIDENSKLTYTGNGIPALNAD